jgi:uncharacterized protein YgiM (DUF1202 family)
VAYVGFWVLLTAAIVVPRPHWYYAAWPCAVLCVALMVSVSVDWHAQHYILEGVVIQDDVIVRKGNGEGFEPQFVEPLHQGVEFTLIETRGSWYHIRLPNGEQGWLPASAAALI